MAEVLGPCLGECINACCSGTASSGCLFLYCGSGRDGCSCKVWTSVLVYGLSVLLIIYGAGMTEIVIGWIMIGLGLLFIAAWTVFLVRKKKIKYQQVATREAFSVHLPPGISMMMQQAGVPDLGVAAIV